MNLNSNIMKSGLAIFIVMMMIVPLSSCSQKKEEMNILFLHHSVGRVIWIGNTDTRIKTLTRKFSDRLAKGELPILFDRYNREHKTGYRIEDQIFPKSAPYGWNNFPYDYYNIWIKHQGPEAYMEEPTLEMLTKENQVIIFKHCFPVSNIEADEGPGEIDSDRKTLPNYKLQYLALRDKLHSFPDTRFILFTGAAQTESIISEEEAGRTREFFQWVMDQWDLPGDNIYLWDFYTLETEGGLYLKEEYAAAPDDPHPNSEFASKAVKLLFNRIIDVIETGGTGTDLTGVDQ
jgi:hypothetical protein